MASQNTFAAFQASGGTAKTTVRTIHKAEITRQGDEVILTIEGDAFLYNMVRILAGTLIHVGCGKLEPGAIRRALESQSRLDLGVTAPARGLTLMRIDYDNADAVEDAV